MQEYKPQEIELKWQDKWRETGIYQPDLKKAKHPFYNLMMFPYPSAEGLHVGNMYAFTGADIYGRFKRMQGFDVFEPMGLDGFGIHSENYALKTGEHPSKVAKRTEKNFYRQLKATGNCFAWDYTLETYDPDYYKWTQWLFVTMYKNGLVERRKAPVNWCSSCKTVLSDEQVINGKCERCDTEVIKKELAQWFFKITNYAERLLENLKKIDWSERVKEMQKNWIGKSEGTRMEFQIKGFEERVSVFTTRPDTIFGATFLALAPEHNLVEKITAPERRKDVEEYISKAKKKSELQRTGLEKKKTGIFTGAYALNPFNGEKAPIWVADFIVMGYGTGAVMGVPGHDQRDWEFAKKYKLPIIKVVEPRPLSNFPKSALSELYGMEAEIKVKSECWEGEGKIVNSGKFNGLSSEEAIDKMTEYAEKNGFGRKEVNYKLRDWCISRQRYWGPPIPMIKCAKCGWVPVLEEDLPVKLPYLKDYQPKGKGESPLSGLDDWVNVKCPSCGGKARRETDILDNFLDSAWYFLRYPSLNNIDAPFGKEVTKKWLPVDMYIGGAEHSVLHLMYARFITMALHDFGLLDFEEPFKKFYAHGLLTKNGAKISKSKGNIIIPDDYVKKLGADTLRIYLMFLGPFDHGGDFTDSGITGAYRFLQSIWQLCLGAHEEFAKQSQLALKSTLHRTIKKVTEDIGALKYNTAIAELMKFKNAWQKQGANALDIGGAKSFLKLLAPFAPHISEELWAQMDGEFSIHQQVWPEYEPGLIKKETFTLIIQVNGKVRAKVEVKDGISQNEAREVAMSSKNAQNWLEGKDIKRVIFAPNKLINFVV